MKFEDIKKLEGISEPEKERLNKYLIKRKKEKEHFKQFSIKPVQKAPYSIFF